LGVTEAVIEGLIERSTAIVSTTLGDMEGLIVLSATLGVTEADIEGSSTTLGVTEAVIEGLIERSTAIVSTTLGDMEELIVLSATLGVTEADIEGS
jgi:hypothetical protein